MASLYWFASSFFLAKKNLSLVSSCHESETLLTQVLGLTETHISLLQTQGILSKSSESSRQGCWMPRRVESVMLLLVDALRFDFCLYNLPKSVGSRLPSLKQQQNDDYLNQTTRLFRFVADPPTVTMQRLKALTTGGLPTFADISANFGGASLEEDSWLHQLMKHTRDDYAARGRRQPAQSAFVGDDTWIDLFPNLFTQAHPYPSFNTRDLNTVDDGCMAHLPNLTHSFLHNDLEMVIVHFLGVDHVGHTYGPHNVHMDAKLQQMDHALANVLDQVDASNSSCQAVLIFGDHGMTEDGNHGGGTEEEVSAALFVHVSPACEDMNEAIALERDSSLLWSASQTFASIHQIDMVSTLSMMLGLPIPFANLGSMVPSLLPGYGHLHVATSLALNAAQVWRYLTIYSETANKLPLGNLKMQLDIAVSAYQNVLDALRQDKVLDADKCNQASGLLKLFLTEALALGQRVWTRFDNVGMIGGVTVLLLASVAYASPLASDGFKHLRRLQRDHMLEVSLALFAMLFLCGLLTFSNSYIYEEQHVIMFSMSLVSIAVAARIRNDSKSCTVWRGVLVLPIASRLNEVLISGHGLDPSMQAHLAHHPLVFVASLAALAAIRCYWYQCRIIKSFWQATLDCLVLFFLAGSWWEKSLADPSRNGFVLCRIALFWLAVGTFTAFRDAMTANNTVASPNDAYPTATFSALFKMAMAIMIVTGPSGAASLVFLLLQAMSIYMLSQLVGSLRIHSFVIATMSRLVIRHMFFATNHGCAFNRLQYSSAFVATDEFYFVFGGLSLFLNTFGWELFGLAFVYMLSKQHHRHSLCRIYTLLQLLEALTSCVSVAMLRRHLMVWDVYAPHFIFVSIFTALHGLWLLSCNLLSIL
ncbi:hypothetical protein MPSEU_000177600 [Mayamaea pseudoterrestris]|nr:hypothetical protein MPSEU_000177600 [Mayamaea pseudoterrestris]